MPLWVESSPCDSIMKRELGENGTGTCSSLGRIFRRRDTCDGREGGTISSGRAKHVRVESCDPAGQFGRVAMTRPRFLWKRDSRAMSVSSATQEPGIWRSGYRALRIWNALSRSCSAAIKGLTLPNGLLIPRWSKGERLTPHPFLRFSRFSRKFAPRCAGALRDGSSYQIAASERHGSRTCLSLPEQIPPPRCSK